MELNDVNPQNAANNTGLPLAENPLAELFENELKTMLWAEIALTHSLPDMIENAYSPALKQALATHLEETKKQVDKVRVVFDLLKRNGAAKKCEAMAGLLKSGQLMMLETERGAQRDAGIIVAAQKVEHYEIASYGSLIAFATALGLGDAAIILGGIMQEEKNADILLNDLALSEINELAALKA